MAPANLIILKSSIDSEMIRDRPNAANNVCKMEPVVIPSTEYIPAFLPWEMLFVNINMVSLPGLRFNRIPAIRNVSK